MAVDQRQTTATALNNASNTTAKCTSPQEILSVATSLTVLFSSELNSRQLSTLINLLALLLAGLSAV
ncbi:MAG: hypothetical protein WAX04_05755, partial [Oscillospiraceae bacterium]